MITEETEHADRVIALERSAMRQSLAPLSLDQKAIDALWTVGIKEREQLLFRAPEELVKSAGLSRTAAANIKRYQEQFRPVWVGQTVATIWEATWAAINSGYTAGFEQCAAVHHAARAAQTAPEIEASGVDDDLNEVDRLAA
ncbi:hypothetical protein [Enterovirga sp. CN4-39]|uniref:hypothetical protein n=1 Tax=Enterovirga sp. CN4-39 TaxID=3400910 RepID=UPI003C0A2ACC